MDLVLSKIASEIVKDYSELSQTVLIGIRRRGVLLAEFLQKKIEELSGSQLPLGILDITFYIIIHTTRFKTVITNNTLNT